MFLVGRVEVSLYISGLVFSSYVYLALVRRKRGSIIQKQPNIPLYNRTENSRNALSSNRIVHSIILRLKDRHFKSVEIF